jgi:alpha-beta hydrolase superfamily lysophospholipase
MSFALRLPHRRSTTPQQVCGQREILVGGRENWTLAMAEIEAHVDLIEHLIFEAAAASLSRHSPDKVDTDNADRGPLLLTMGGKDHTVPEAITKSTPKQYRHSPAKTNLVEFEDRGHSLTIDSGWSEVAEACVAWLDEQGL